MPIIPSQLDSLLPLIPDSEIVNQSYYCPREIEDPQFTSVELVP